MSDRSQLESFFDISCERQVLPCLSPKNYNSGASLLGAHAEGPYLQGSKSGAHSSSLFKDPLVTPDAIYGTTASSNAILKLVTVAPELPNSATLIKSLSSKDIRVSLGHSLATYDQGLTALSGGASCLTHVLNCMAPLHQRNPGLSGLISLTEKHAPPTPYYTLVCDGIHLHPSVATILFRAAPTRAIIISDSIELTGLPDGVYLPNQQIHHKQRKEGERVTLEDTDTLVGSCITVAQGVKNMVKWDTCDIAQAVRAVTENVADFMGVKDRGKLEEGRRADFVVIDDSGEVLQTWIAGVRVWERGL
jgi:N-acetylglucosamine-6-phosphate deacetylase